MAKAALLAPAGRLTVRPTKKLCTAMAAISGGIILSCIGLYVWQSGEMATREKVVVDKVNEVEHGEKVAMRLNQMQEDFSLTNGKLRYLESSVSPEAYIPTLLKQIDALAKSTDLKVIRFTHRTEKAPAPPTDKEKLKTFVPQPYDKEHMEMDVEGAYWNIARFIQRLTEFPKIIAVSSITATPQSPETGKSPVLASKIRMTGFVFLADGRPETARERRPAVGSVSALRAEEKAVIDPAPQPPSSQAPR